MMTKALCDKQKQFNVPILQILSLSFIFKNVSVQRLQ